MNKLVRSILLFTSVFSLASCSSEGEIALKEMRQLRSPEGLSHEVDYSIISEEGYKTFKEKVNTFASKISDSYAKREFNAKKNLAISPISIELCLGLAIRSANGKTRQELLNCFDVDYATFNRYYKVLFNELTLERTSESNELMSQILLTNSIWIDDEVTLKDEGLDALRDDYYCYSYEADFNHNNAKTNKAIQEFIRKQTKGLLNPELNLDEETLFVLMNTIYLKDIWNEFGNDISLASETYKFKNYDGSLSNKRLLEGYYFPGKKIETEDYSAFYTKGQSFSLYFVKPNDGKRINQIFDADLVKEISNRKNYIEIDEEKKEIYETYSVFPEYEAGCDYELTDMFREDFKVNSLFNDSCDMSDLSNIPVFCSTFKQISKLKVNRKGIEGAAVTYMAYSGSAGPIEDYTLIQDKFVVDKEFGYVLTYKDTILFSGIVTNID